MIKTPPFTINSKKNGNSTAFIEFMLLAISETLDKNMLVKNAPKNTPINALINFIITDQIAIGKSINKI